MVLPLLFVIALERLSHCIQDTVNNGSWSALKFGRGGPTISHLLFADDILLVAEASSSNAATISSILDTFSSCFGQTVNKAKSSIFFSLNTPSHVANRLVSSWAFLAPPISDATLEFLSLVEGKAKLTSLS